MHKITIDIVAEYLVFLKRHRCIHSTGIAMEIADCFSKPAIVIVQVNNTICSGIIPQPAKCISNLATSWVFIVNINICPVGRSAGFYNSYNSFFVIPVISFASFFKKPARIIVSIINADETAAKCFRFGNLYKLLCGCFCCGKILFLAA